MYLAMFTIFKYLFIFETSDRFVYSFVGKVPAGSDEKQVAEYPADSSNKDIDPASINPILHADSNPTEAPDISQGSTINDQNLPDNNQAAQKVCTPSQPSNINPNPLCNDNEEGDEEQEILNVGFHIHGEGTYRTTEEEEEESPNDDNTNPQDDATEQSGDNEEKSGCCSCRVWDWLFG